MKPVWDFNELTIFVNELEENELEDRLMKVTRDIARVLHQEILEETPVKTGNLRKMWSAGDNLLFTVEKVKDGFQVTFVNTARNAPENGEMYGILVNDGYTNQSGKLIKGRFFVENSIDFTEPIAHKMIYKELQKWWGLL